MGLDIITQAFHEDDKELFPTMVRSASVTIVFHTPLAK